MKRLFAVFAFALASVCLIAGCGKIEQGHAGVRTSFNGEISPQVMGTGFYVAVTDSVTEYTTKEVTIPFENLTPKARDNLSLQKLDLSVYYTTSPAALVKFQATKANMSVYANGVYYPGFNLIRDTALGTINDSISKFDSLTLHTQRDGLEAEIKTSLQRQLNASDPGTFTVTRVIVKVMDTDKSIEQSIRDNVQASMRLGSAEKEVKIKEQQALGNKAVTASMTPAYLQGKYIDAIALCASNPKCTLIVDGSSAGNAKILNVGPR